MRVTFFIATLYCVSIGSIPATAGDMVFIPGGTFQMGDSIGDGYSDERPVHSVTLHLFYMGRYEITNDQYCAYLNSAYQQGLITVTSGVVYKAGSGGTSYPYCDTSTSSSDSQIAHSGGVFAVRTKGNRNMANDPMVCVTWYGAVAYCNWRSQHEGKELCYNMSTWTCDFSKKGYRLPTEAQWEYAARGGLSGKRFPWGDTITHSQANYFSSSGYNYDVSPTRGFHPTWNDGIHPYTSPVGSFAANGYGLHDMAGNVYEWCYDWHHSYSSSPQTNPTGPASGSDRVVRAGGWYATAYYHRATYRYASYYPGYRNYGYGFRVSLYTEASGVSGRIENRLTHEGIANAEVYVATMPSLSAVSDSSGHYEITGVPYDTLLTLVASAAGYKTLPVTMVEVTHLMPAVTVDISLTPDPWTSLKLVELTPNPNSNPMEIMHGGIGHRYYQILDQDGHSKPGISVTTSPALHGPFLSSDKIRGGVVSIDVNSLEVTDGQTITITKLGTIVLTPLQQKSFTVHIKPLEQEKVWDLQAAADLSLSNPTGEVEGTLEIRLRDTQGSDAAPEVTSISRKSLLGAGLSGSLRGVAAGARIVGQVIVGGWGGVGGSITGGAAFRDAFEYAYDTTDLSQNVAKLDLLLYPTALLCPVLATVQAGLEVTLLNDYRQELEVGVYKKGSGSVGGVLGFGSSSPDVEIGVGIAEEGNGSIQGAGTCVYHKDGTQSLAVEISGRGQWRSQAHVPPGHISTTGAAFSDLVGRAGKVRFEGLIAQNGLKEVRIALEWPSESGTVPAYSSSGEELSFCIKGTPQDLAAIITPSGIFDMLSHATEIRGSRPVLLTRDGIAEELETILCSAQSVANLAITYEQKRLSANVINYPVFELHAGVGVVAEVSVGANLEGKITETRELTIERGIVCGSKLYPIQSYSENIYPPVNVSLADVYAKAFADAGQSAIQSLLDFQEQIAQASEPLILNAGSSFLQIGADVLAAGQKVTNIFGASAPPSPMAAMGAMPPTTGSPENEFFGIGGSYRLEPADLSLSTPATFTISYSDSDVGSKDESLFKMYRWNDSTGRWELVGGVVNVGSNTVTVSITRLGTYAISARVVYGAFTFTPDPNGVPADGNSIVTFTSQTITNNDGTQVTDGTLFSVAFSGGTITTADANALLDGVQVATSGGILQFALKAPQVGMQAKVVATSLTGLATVTGSVAFTDSTPPSAPTGLHAQITEGKVLLSWNANTEIDVAGYEVYFDDDQGGAPYNGITYYSGTNSPVDVAGATRHFLRGLRSGHTYYITLTAYDMSGNQSSYGSEIVFVNTLPEDSDSDGMPDAWENSYAADANGLDSTANDAMADNDRDGMTNLEEYLTGHNPLVADMDGDFNHNRYVDLSDLYVFLSHWLQTGCTSPNWCDGCDFDLSGNVNFVDFTLLAKHWYISLGSPVVFMPADFNRNEHVDWWDLLILSEQWLQSPGVPSADIAPEAAPDHFVNLLDFAEFAKEWMQE